MGRINVLFGIAAVCFALSACGSQTAGSAEGIDVPAVVDAGGVKFDMVAVEGGSFAMGKTPAGTKIADVTIHEVVLDGFSISGKPVSRQLWEAVMNEQRGSSTSPEAPVDMVSQDDCKKFLSKLSKMTGIPFALPTEAQWEYAVSQGLVEVPAKFEEWCADSYQPLTSNELVHNPFCTEKRDAKVVRTAIKRNEEVNYIRKPALGFRVVANTKTAVPQDIIDAIIDHKVTREDKSEAEVIEVGNVKYRMVPVKGGSFDMGATAEQSAKAAGEDEKVRECLEHLNLTGQYYFFKMDRAQHQTPYDEIRYFEGRGRKVCMHCEEKDYEFYEKISTVAKGLDDSLFCRIHVSFVVNMDKIRELCDTEVVMENGERLPISKAYRQEVREKHLNYMMMKSGGLT